MNKILALTLILAAVVNTYAQKDIKLTINHKLGTEDFALDKEAQNDLGQQFKINRLEYYISGISLIHDGGQELQLPDRYILVDVSKENTFLLSNSDLSTIEAISFCIGVDSGVNNDDPAQWPSNHALAPKFPSMHWGWSSGYRFVALEGKSGDNFAQDFQIHALGNQNYFRQRITVDPKEQDGVLEIILNADYTKSISGMNIKSGLLEHSAGSAPAKCLRYFQTAVFSNEAGEGNTLGIDEWLNSGAFALFPNPTNGEVSIKLDEKQVGSAYLRVTNMLGETIKEIAGEDMTQKIYVENPGVYFISLYNNGRVDTKRLIVQ